MTRWFVTALCFSISVIIIYFWFKSNGNLSIFNSQESLQAYIDSFGAKAPIIFIIIQIVQVIISPIPGNITTLAGGALFGFWPAFLYSSIAVILGSIAAFTIARYLGHPLVVRFIGQHSTDKYLSVIHAKGKVVLATMFLMPFFPDDIICFIAGISGVSYFFFIITVILTRPWGLLFSAFIGSGALTLSIWSWLCIGIFTTFIFYLSFHYANHIESFFIKRFHRHPH